MTAIRDLLGEGFPAVEKYEQVTSDWDRTANRRVLHSQVAPVFRVMDAADQMRDELAAALRWEQDTVEAMYVSGSMLKWERDYERALREVVEAAYREASGLNDTSFCIFCQTTMEKDLTVMLEHAQRCEKRPENVLLRRLEQAEQALAALTEKSRNWGKLMNELMDERDGATEALAAEREALRFMWQHQDQFSDYGEWRAQYPPYEEMP